MKTSIYRSSTNIRSLFRISLVMFLSFLIIGINWVFLQSGTKYLLDFGSFIASGIAAAEGQDPYSTNSPLIMVVYYKWTGASIPAPNLNPPITVLLFESISKYDPFHALKLWRILSFAGYVLTVFILARVYRNTSTLFHAAWALCLAGFWHTIHLGQVYIPLLIAVAAFWLLCENKQLKLAGIALGVLISIKPNFAYWAILLGISGYWSTFFITGVTAVLVSIIPLMVYGPNIYLQWMATLQGSPEAGLLLPGNSSLQSLSLHLFGHSGPGIALSIIIALIGMYIAFRGRSDLQKVNSLGILISLLISPIAWTGYTILTLPIFMSKSRWSIMEKIPAALFVIPIWVVLAISFYSQTAFHIFGWLYGWGLLFLLAGVFTAKQPISM